MVESQVHGLLAVLWLRAIHFCELLDLHPRFTVMLLGKVKVFDLTAFRDQSTLWIRSFELIQDPEQTLAVIVVRINTFEQVVHKDVFIALADGPRLV